MYKKIHTSRGVFCLFFYFCGQKLQKRLLFFAIQLIPRALIFLPFEADITDKGEYIHTQGGGLMDIPALSMALAQNNIKNDYGVAMLAKSLDNLEANGAAMVSAMNSMPSPSLDPNVGQNIDISI